MVGTDRFKTIGRHILEQATNELADYSIGFAKLIGTGPSEDAVLAGSGTLVSVRGLYAILTADHVLMNLPDSGDVGLILPTRFPAALHRVTVDMELAPKVKIARGSLDSDGPDIGALLLPLPIVDIIKRNKSFYNISKRRIHAAEYLPIDRGGWILSGMAQDWTYDASPERGYQKVKIFRGMHGLGIVSAEREVDKYDYLDFEVEYVDACEGPESYQGFSGGGLWQLDLRKNQSGDYVVEDKIFSGVAFYQYDRIGDFRTIVCNGRRSIYEVAEEAIVSASC